MSNLLDRQQTALGRTDTRSAPNGLTRYGEQTTEPKR
jgi:hypothetical protein